MLNVDAAPVIKMTKCPWRYCYEKYFQSSYILFSLCWSYSLKTLPLVPGTFIYVIALWLSILALSVLFSTLQLIYLLTFSLTKQQTSASAVRNITSAAINLLQSTSDIIESNKEPQGLKRKSELISIPSSVDKEQELVELKLTFLEFEKLYSVGKITREQMRSGMVPRSVYEMCMNYLSAEADFTKQTEKSHDLVLHDLPSSVDCGLKRVDSKRYKRDYIINKEKMSIRQKVLDKRQTSGFGASDIIKSTPAGVREDPHEKISEAQEQVLIVL